MEIMMLGTLFGHITKTKRITSAFGFVGRLFPVFSLVFFLDFISALRSH